ncbi:MAG: hypothetical protein AAGU05_09925, partial [Anaerolineaceae bacterium]
AEGQAKQHSCQQGHAKGWNKFIHRYSPVVNQGKRCCDRNTGKTIDNVCVFGKNNDKSSLY